MDYVELGNTGLDVSPICLGCMSYGQPERGYPWVHQHPSSRSRSSA
jgi:aryl-alcohol dehydrogenase-like predicted oxidoreductase